MKAKFCFLAMLFVLQLSMHAQTITSITPNAAVTGQGLTVNILGSGTNFTSATSTYLFNGAQYIYPTVWTPMSATSIVATYNIPPSATPGIYDVVAWQSGSVTLTGGFTIGTGVPSGNYAQVSGRVYKDANANCVYNSGESVYANRIVQILPGPYYATTDASGNYSTWIPLGTYDVSFAPPSPYTATCPPSGSRNITLSFNGQMMGAQDFATDSITYTDARIFLGAQRLRPGFTSNIGLFASNSGTSAILSGVVKFLKPSFTTLVSSNPIPTSISGDTLIWTFTNLMAPVNYYLSLSTPITVPLNTPYVLDAWIIPNPMDLVQFNNQYHIQTLVSGSYDPNEKHVQTQSGAEADGDIVQSDSLLVYEVEFQNTGTDTAFNVFVRDTLDATHLDLSTFRLLHSSHPYQLASSNTGQIELAFTNILLPDSGTNEVGSHGRFYYEIKRRPNLPLGTVIPNSAAIYFDFNAPVITNTTQTRICEVLAANFTSAPNGFAVQFTDQSVGTITAHAWDFGDGATSILASPSHTYAANGTYTVCETVTNVCGTHTHCDTITINVVGLSNPYSSCTITLVPNPVLQSASLTVSDHSHIGEFQLAILDVRGSIVRTLTGQFNEAMTIERGGLVAGMYIYRITQGNEALGMGKILME